MTGGGRGRRHLGGNPGGLKPPGCVQTLVMTLGYARHLWFMRMTWGLSYAVERARKYNHCMHVSFDPCVLEAGAYEEDWDSLSEGDDDFDVSESFVHLHAEVPLVPSSDALTGLQSLAVHHMGNENGLLMQARRRCSYLCTRSRLRCTFIVHLCAEPGAWSCEDLERTVVEVPAAISAAVQTLPGFVGVDRGVHRSRQLITMGVRPRYEFKFEERSEREGDAFSRLHYSLREDFAFSV